MKTLLDQLNERVVPTELATGTELGVDASHVLTSSLQFSASYYQPTFIVKVGRCKRIAGEGFTDCENGTTPNENTSILTSYLDFCSSDSAGAMASGGM